MSELEELNWPKNTDKRLKYFIFQCCGGGFFSLTLSKNVNKLFYLQRFFLKMWTPGQRILKDATLIQCILSCKVRAVKSWKGLVHMSPNQKWKQREQQVTGYQTEFVKIFWGLFACEKRNVFIQRCPWIPAASCNALVPVPFLPFSVTPSAERTPVNIMKGFVGSYTPAALQNSF